jgi:hypothetical protein
MQSASVFCKLVVGALVALELNADMAHGVLRFTTLVSSRRYHPLRRLLLYVYPHLLLYLIDYGPHARDPVIFPILSRLVEAVSRRTVICQIPGDHALHDSISWYRAGKMDVASIVAACQTSCQTRGSHPRKNTSCVSIALSHRVRTWQSQISPRTAHSRAASPA